MQNYRVSKGKLPAVIHVPTSKSYANRALILAAVKKSPVTISKLPEAGDVTHLVEALRKTGLTMKTGFHSVTIVDSFPECETMDKEIQTGEGGTTARFLSALLLRGKKKYSLVLGNRLKDRPWQELLDVSAHLGASAELTGNTLTVQGPIKVVSSLEVDCSRTTQFATAFDLASGSKVNPVHLSASESYWKMNAVLKEHFLQHDTYAVPVDWSSAAFPMVFAALNHEISFPDLTPDPLQADSKILSILSRLGALRDEEGIIKVGPHQKSADIRFDMRDCLDLFPALSFLLAHIEGTHELTGLENLVHKESDRLAEVKRLLTTFEREYEEKTDHFIIKGSKGICSEKHLTLPDDHRIVMTAALFLRHHSGGTLDQVRAVDKSYPQFFDLLR